jgi:hypothetical protein
MVLGEILPYMVEKQVNPVLVNEEASSESDDDY